MVFHSKFKRKIKKKTSAPITGRRFFFVILAVTSFNLMAHITRFDVHNSKKVEFSYSEACSSLGPNQTTLINFLDINRLGCMGKILSTNEFCQTKFGDDPTFMRGFIDPKKEKVICQTGERIWAEWECQEKESNPNLSYCVNSNEGCSEMKKLLAKNLILHHHSFTQAFQKGSKTLSCHFISKNFLPPLSKTL